MVHFVQYIASTKYVDSGRQTAYILLFELRLSKLDIYSCHFLDIFT